MPIIDKAKAQQSLDAAAIRATKGCRAARSGRAEANCDPIDIPSCAACIEIGAMANASRGVQSFSFTGVSEPSPLFEEMLASIFTGVAEPSPIFKDKVKSI